MDGDNLQHFAAIIDSQSQDELKLALLRAIDHARKNSADIAAYKAQLDGAMGTIHELREQIDSLKQRLRAAASVGPRF